MATQSSIITVEGKIGNIVGMKGRNGRSYARARVTPKNPKTTQQSIQRVIFATVAKNYAALKSICDHSFEGVQYGARSQQEFMKINLRRFRDFFAHNYPDYDSEIGLIDTLAFFGRDSIGFDLAVGAQISKGSLPPLSPNVDNDGQLLSFGDALNASAKIADVWDNNELQKGDQITVVISAAKTNSPNEIFKSRYVVNADATTEQMAEAWDPTGAADAFDHEKTLVTMARLTADADGLKAVMTNQDYYICGAAVIVSRKVGSEWLRSTAYLYNAKDESALDSPELALAEYMSGATEIDTVSDRYLNNADRLGE